MDFFKMKVKLNYKQRHALVELLHGFQGTKNDLPVILDDIKNVRITDKEWKAVNMSQIAPDRISWNEELEKPKDIELSAEAITYIKKTVNAKSEKGELGIADQDIFEVFNMVSKTK